MGPYWKLTLVVHLTVAVDVGLADHFVDLLVGQLLAEVGHQVTQLGRGDEPVAVLPEKNEWISDRTDLQTSLLYPEHYHFKYQESQTFFLPNIALTLVFCLTDGTCRIFPWFLSLILSPNMPPNSWRIPTSQREIESAHGGRKKDPRATSPWPGFKTTTSVSWDEHYPLDHSTLLIKV